MSSTSTSQGVYDHEAVMAELDQIFAMYDGVELDKVCVDAEPRLLQRLSVWADACLLPHTEYQERDIFRRLEDLWMGSHYDLLS